MWSSQICNVCVCITVYFDNSLSYSNPDQFSAALLWNLWST